MRRTGEAASLRVSCRPALESLRTALIELLVAEFKAERLPVQEGAYSHEVRIDGQVVNITWSADDHHVGIYMDRGTDSQMVETIAMRFDQALATRKYDSMFEQ